jgi:hypothetical protein
MKIKEKITRFISSLSKFFRRSKVERGIKITNKTKTQIHSSAMADIGRKNMKIGHSHAWEAQLNPIYFPSKHTIQTWREQQRAAKKRRKAV